MAAASYAELLYDSLVSLEGEHRTSLFLQILMKQNRTTYPVFNKYSIQQVQEQEQAFSTLASTDKL